MITSKDLDLISAIAKTETFVEASQKLHITQSALSHQLKSLEKKIGAELVHRTSKPLRFTEVGERIEQSAKDILPMFKRLDDDIATIVRGETGRLRIGIECHACYQWLMPTLNQYRKRWPTVELDIADGERFDTLQALAENYLEICITADPQPMPTIEYLPLFDYECILLVPNEHPLATKAVIEPQDINGETVITYPVPRNRIDLFRLFLTPASIEPIAIRTSELTVMSVQLVASGRGLFSLPSWAADEYTTPGYVTARRLGERGVFSTLYAAVQKSYLDREYIRDFVYEAKDISLTTLTHIKATEEAT